MDVSKKMQEDKDVSGHSRSLLEGDQTHKGYHTYADKQSAVYDERIYATFFKS